ncbi:MAG: hypothetical protein WKF40_02555 [Thermoleophilaceae bacterium]
MGRRADGSRASGAGGRGGGGAGGRRAKRRRGLHRRGRRHSLRRLRGRLQPRPAHRRRGALPVGPVGGHLPAPDGACGLPGDSAARLAPAGAAIARAEGFPVHAESMERRA